MRGWQERHSLVREMAGQVRLREGERMAGEREVDLRVSGWQERGGLARERAGQESQGWSSWVRK